MRHFGALVLGTVFCVEGFVLNPGVSSFISGSVAHRVRWRGRTGSSSLRNGICDTVMSVDGGKIMVSGFLNSKERTDQFVFDILQAQGKWEKIVAFSDNMSFAKKRLISRKSRYSGLLDVLEFDEGDKYDPTIMETKLQGCSAWLCFDCEGSKIENSVEVAKKAGVKSMVITSTVAANDPVMGGIEDILQDSGLEFTFIRVGEMIEGKEGGAVVCGNITSELPQEQVVRDDIIRLSAESFVMENVTGKVFAFGKGDEIALDYLKELRQNGTDRRTEMSTLISGGLVEYREIKAAEEAERNKPPPTPEELAEQEREFLKSREEEYAAIYAENARQREIDYQEKLEKEARELLEGEWNSMYWTRDTIMSLEEYINDEDNWERAMEHARAVMKKRREDRYGTSSSDDEEDEEEEEEEEEIEDGAESLGGDTEGAVGGDVEEEGQSESSSEGATDVVAGKEGSASGKSKKTGKAETESAAQEIVAESADELGSDGADTSPPQAKLDDNKE